MKPWPPNRRREFRKLRELLNNMADINASGDVLTLLQRCEELATDLTNDLAGDGISLLTWLERQCFGEPFATTIDGQEAVISERSCFNCAHRGQSAISDKCMPCSANWRLDGVLTNWELMQAPFSGTPYATVAEGTNVERKE